MSDSQKTEKKLPTLGPRVEIFNVMVVGKSGIGKTCFQRTIFGRAVEANRDTYQAFEETFNRLSSGVSTRGIDEEIDPVKIPLDGGDTIMMKLYDSEGYGESASLTSNWAIIMKFLSKKFASKDEIHLVIYLLEPHRLNGADVEFMTLLSEFVNVVPVIAKADTMDPEQKNEWKKRLYKLLVDRNVKFFDLSRTDEIFCISGSELGDTRKYSKNHQFDLIDPEVSDLELFQTELYENYYELKKNSERQHRLEWKKSQAWKKIISNNVHKAAVSTFTYFFYLFIAFAVFFFGFTFGKLSVAPKILDFDL